MIHPNNGATQSGMKKSKKKIRSKRNAKAVRSADAKRADRIMRDKSDRIVPFKPSA
jgi:hypothetical protein